ncbi:MAG: tetratricopeptide repeat protein, partial [Anaerolineales bacterium]|nr:tetratricopeptide repeat protein [Anaerolineales bacterium]
MAVFLGVLNVPNGPLSGLAQTRSLNRLASMFDEIQGNTGTGRVRVLIWTGVVEMMTPHAALETPAGQPDVWNAIRPLVGYGPEAMLVAYNRFYPPELGQLEARNASPDRSHNETFDALAFTGILGLLAQMSLFVGLFYYSLKWLGLIGSPARRNIFLALVLGGGALSTGLFVYWQGPQFFGVSLPFGMLLGLIAFLTLYALLPANVSAPRREAWQAVALISLFTAIVAHFTEIHFGIAIVSTRTHFWIFVGVLIVLGEVWPRLEPRGAGEPLPAAAPVKGAARAGRRRPAGGEGAGEEAPLLPVALTLGVMAPLLLTLGFDFITNANRSTQAPAIIGTALTTVNAQPSFGILGLLLLTWLLGGALVYLEETVDRPAAGWLGGLAASLGFTALAAGLTWLIHAGVLAGIAAYQPRTVDELKNSVNLVAGVLTWYYALLFVCLAAWAGILASARPGLARARAEMTPLAWLGVAGLGPVALVLSVLLNLQVIQADVIYKTGLQFDEQGQPAVAVELFKNTLALAPSQDFYYLFLGRSYLNASSSAPAEQRDGLFETAQAELFKAQAINPLNTDHTANLARLNRQWAVLTIETAARQTHAAAADKYYGQALKLSPNNAGLWNEWALLQMQLLGKTAEARTYLERSLALDSKFDQTYWYLGDLYQTEARVITDTVAQQAAYQKAEAAYAEGVKIGEAGRATSLLNLHLGLASVYVATNQLQPAIEQYLRVAELNAGVGQWQVYRALGELYRQTGDLVQARAFGTQAVSAAPDADKPTLQAWLDSLPQQ